MSDVVYRMVRALGKPVWWATAAPVVIGQELVPRRGACIIAATHQSPYDVPVLMAHTRRLLDFVSIVEVFRNPLVAWFYGSLNAFPLDRSRPDGATVRVILRRLERGRVVAMFPEGGFKKGEESVIHSRRIRPGIGRISSLSAAPIVPCVLIGSFVYSRFTSWLPVRRTRYGVIYGEPLPASLEPDVLEARLVDAFVGLHRQLRKAMDQGVKGSSRGAPAGSS